MVKLWNVNRMCYTRTEINYLRRLLMNLKHVKKFVTACRCFYFSKSVWTNIGVVLPKGFAFTTKQGCQFSLLVPRQERHPLCTTLLLTSPLWIIIQKYPISALFPNQRFEWERPLFSEMTRSIFTLLSRTQSVIRSAQLLILCTLRRRWNHSLSTLILRNILKLLVLR